MISINKFILFLFFVIDLVAADSDDDLLDTFDIIIIIKLIFSSIFIILVVILIYKCIKSSQEFNDGQYTGKLLNLNFILTDLLK